MLIKYNKYCCVEDKAAHLSEVNKCVNNMPSKPHKCANVDYYAFGDIPMLLT